MIDAVRAHPLVQQAMEIFDATSIRVRAKSAAQPERGLLEAAPDDAEAAPDDAEPAPMIDAPAAAGGDA
ncbi:MAG: hypothetical protein FGM37_08775 [Phycisphaerales bacterium]|nr:hypothetical protein [Phycisphaerales bacterium]